MKGFCFVEPIALRAQVAKKTERPAASFLSCAFVVCPAIQGAAVAALSLIKIIQAAFDKAEDGQAFGHLWRVFSDDYLCRIKSSPGKVFRLRIITHPFTNIGELVQGPRNNRTGLRRRLRLFQRVIQQTDRLGVISPYECFAPALVIIDAFGHFTWMWPRIELNSGSALCWSICACSAVSVNTLYRPDLDSRRT